MKKKGNTKYKQQIHMQYLFVVQTHAVHTHTHLQTQTCAKNLTRKLFCINTCKKVTCKIKQ